MRNPLTQFKNPLAFFLARNGGNPFCAISGHHRFYADEELDALFRQKLQTITKLARPGR